MKFYHMIIEPKANLIGETDNRKEYISEKQGEAPDGWRCVGVCGYHEIPSRTNVKQGLQTEAE